NPVIWAALSVLAVLPLIACDPRLRINMVLRVLLGIAPFAATVGYLTPKLVDKWSGGDPDRASSAYAVNILGCILGPLIGGFLLLPRLSERWTLLVFAAPWLFITPTSLLRRETAHKRRKSFPALAIGTMCLALFLISRSFEEKFPGRRVLRDNTATVLATGDGMQKR